MNSNTTRLTFLLFLTCGFILYLYIPSFPALQEIEVILAALLGRDIGWGGGGMLSAHSDVTNLLVEADAFLASADTVHISTLDTTKKKHVSRNDQLAAAIRKYAMVADMSPRYRALALARRGSALQRLDPPRLQEAVESFQRSLAITPTTSSAWTNRGLALDALGNSEMAIESWTRALGILEAKRAKEDISSFPP